MARCSHADRAEYFRWYVTDEVTGKRRLTDYKMDRTTALNATPMPGRSSRVARFGMCWRPASRRAGTATKASGSHAIWPRFTLTASDYAFMPLSLWPALR